MSTSQTPDLSELFGGAQQEGILGGNLAGLAVDDLGEQIQQGLGVGADTINSSEVFLCTIDVDDSGSISSKLRRGPGGRMEATGQSNEQVVRDGHNMVLDELMKSKSEGDILVMTCAFNRGVISPFTPLAQAVRLNDRNYAGDGGTPLYDHSVATLLTVVAKEQEFSNEGIPCRTATLITTDGRDEHSRKYRARDVAEIVMGLRRKENHIIAGMGIDDGQTDFRQIFREMGIEDKWILTPGNTGSEIRKAFGVFSKTSARASQGAAAFSQTAGGGFASI